MFALNSKLKLEAAVVVLQANETVDSVEDANTADVAQEVVYRGGYRGKGRSRGRGSRGVSRGGSRGGISKLYNLNRCGRASSGSIDRNRDRNSSGKGKEENKGDLIRCW
ncbi:hypothetical protein ACMFMG_001494 [Clarireedia jacksonii]